MFSKAKITELKARFASVDVNSIEDSSLRAKARKLKKQAGFTLLELLVVVAILAAVAGTATIALKDTDARASAAAHVAMMDELNKGVITFRVLNKNVLPNNFDSLIEVGVTTSAAASYKLRAVVSGATTAAASVALPTGAAVVANAAIEDVGIFNLTEETAALVYDGGMKQLQYVSTDASFDPEGEENCSTLKDLINNKHNAVVAGNVFMSPDANGCGFPAVVAEDRPVMLWTGGYERVLGENGTAYDVSGGITVSGGNITAGVENAPLLMAVGMGPSSDLFDQNKMGGMTTVPVYRHVGADEYNRFVALFYIGIISGPVVSGAAPVSAGNDNMHLVSVVDGAGDTKEEELGEWDGTRNTI